MTLTQQTEHKSTACKAPRKQLLNNAARKSAPTTLDVRSLIAIGLDLTVVLHEGTTCASDTSKNKPVLIRVFGMRQATADKSPRKHDDNKTARKSAPAMGGVRKSPFSMPASQRGSVPNPSPSEVYRDSHPSASCLFSDLYMRSPNQNLTTHQRFQNTAVLAGSADSQWGLPGYHANLCAVNANA
ncbi:hypothetical protein Aperf_G00000048695 [Anoplocephala perfoliata]